MKDVLIETVIGKIDIHEKKILEMEQKFRNETEAKDMTDQLHYAADILSGTLKDISTTAEEMREFLNKLEATNVLLRQPVKQTVIHHHYFNKALSATIILFIVSVILIVFLVNATNQVAENNASDFKYRFLKLNNDVNLRSVLQEVDSLYLADPSQLQKNVIKEEARRKEQAELMREAEEKEREAKFLKEKATRN